ncbi:MAG: hypothetical protein ACRD26_10585 [Vicinamibacterales bacterium]
MTRLLLAGALVAALSQALSAAELLLQNAWIDAHKNRALVEATFTVDRSHATPNSAAKDGDLHVAGRAPAVGLPLVVEVVNARLDAHKPLLQQVKAAEKSKVPVTLAGVWRLWFEHPGRHTHTQGASVPVPKNTNPDHVFEIHPVTHFSDGTLDDSLEESFVDIKGYSPADATRAFEHYERQVFTVNKGATFTSIQAKQAGFNYSRFAMVLTSLPKPTVKRSPDGKSRIDEGGLVVLARVETLDGKQVLTAAPRRMVFVPGTAPRNRVATAQIGDRFQVIGIPRINLERLMKSANAKPGRSVAVKGAYEIIVVGMLDE